MYTVWPLSWGWLQDYLHNNWVHLQGFQALAQWQKPEYHVILQLDDKASIFLDDGIGQAVYHLTLKFQILSLYSLACVSFWLTFCQRKKQTTSKNKVRDDKVTKMSTLRTFWLKFLVYFHFNSHLDNISWFRFSGQERQKIEKTSSKLKLLIMFSILK